MALEVSIHEFLQELDCVYKEERYSARDNGAVLRHSRDGKRLRPNDNQWTFGNPNDNGVHGYYLCYCSQNNSNSISR